MILGSPLLFLRDWTGTCFAPGPFPTGAREPEGTDDGCVLNVCQTFGRVAECFFVDAELVHQREIQTAHLAVWLIEVVERSPRLQLAATSAENHHRQFGGIVLTSSEHA